MLNRHTLVRTALAAALVGVGLAGCGQMRPQNKYEFFEATLSGTQEVPPVAPSGTGTAELRYNENTNIIRWKVSYAGLSGPPTGAHIHGPAGPGQNAGIVVPFVTDLSRTPIEGEAKLTPEQANQLMSGLYYVNIHTAKNPAGEIRGQLRPRR